MKCKCWTMSLIAVVAVSVTLVAEGRSEEGSAEPYDYFRNAQLPMKRRPDVSLDRVEQEGGPDCVGHRKRVVDWWPKRGVDIVDVPKGAICRIHAVCALSYPRVARVSTRAQDTMLT